jgi:TolB protein
MSDDPIHSTEKNGERQPVRIWIYRIFLVVVVVGIVFLGWYSLQLRQPGQPDPMEPTLSPLTTSLAVAPTMSPGTDQDSPSTASTPNSTDIGTQGTIFFTARTQARSHIWAYAIGDEKPVQITFGEWDDRNPAFNPDGGLLAFTSNRGIYWDLYLLDLNSGNLRQLTETPGFEGSPTWSPDGRWIAYEANYDGDFDIYILPVMDDEDVIQLTNHPANDNSPDWDTGGRRIAFISDRDGSPDVFIAKLDQPDERFVNLTQTIELTESDPAYSPQGDLLAYSINRMGFEEILIKEIEGELPPSPNGQGHGVRWSPDSKALIAVLEDAYERWLVAFAHDGGQSPGLPIHFNIEDLFWTAEGLPAAAYQWGEDEAEGSPLYVIELTSADATIDRLSLAPLPGVTAPNASLSDAVDEAFNALRARVAVDLGWDFLSTLEHAFVGINDPLPPGLSYDDWLFTGRAFAFSQAAVQAGWIEMVREDFGGLWDFQVRYEGAPQFYDQGGRIKENIPPGYYVDFTQLAADYGFERVPALPNWRTYYHGARFNEFVYRDHRNWIQAMLELYPNSAIITPTPFQTPTPTPTRTPKPTPTPWWWRWRTPTPIPTSTAFPTPTTG